MKVTLHANGEDFTLEGPDQRGMWVVVHHGPAGDVRRTLPFTRNGMAIASGDPLRRPPVRERYRVAVAYIDSLAAGPPFTRENPFKFEGVSIYRNDAGNAFWDHAEGRGTLSCDLLIRAAAAFHEAESHPTTWTDMGDETFRKGLFVVSRGKLSSVAWVLRHDDFPAYAIVHPNPGDDQTMHRLLRVEMDDFLAWYAKQNEITEPTGLGARVLSDQGVRFVRLVKGDWLNLTTHIVFTWDKIAWSIIKVEDTGVES